MSSACGQIFSETDSLKTARDSPKSHIGLVYYNLGYVTAFLSLGYLGSGRNVLIAWNQLLRLHITAFVVYRQDNLFGRVFVNDRLKYAFFFIVTQYLKLV